MQRIPMPAGDAAEEFEVSSILSRLRAAGHAVDVAAPRLGQVSSRGRGDRAEFGEGFLGAFSGVAAT